MGDLLAPNKRHVFDRLRRRIEDLRRHHNSRLLHHGQCVNGLYDQQIQESQLLIQRWQESKAKNKAKSKSKQDNNASLEQRSHILSQRGLKRKHDGHGSSDVSSNVVTTAAESAYNFTDEPTSPPPVKAPCTNQTDTCKGLHIGSSVSVDIVQEINTNNQSDHQVKVTVRSTVQTGPGGQNSQHTLSEGGQGPSHIQSTGSTQIHTTSTANICKKEPVDDQDCTNQASQSGFPEESIGLDDIEELQAILDTLEKETGEIPPDLIKVIDKGIKEACVSDSPSTDSEDPLASKSPMYSSGGGNKGSAGPGMYADPPGLYESAGSVSQNMTMGGQGAAAMNYARPPTGGGAAPPAPPILGDTGPAAETLKQMAAQHQSQSPGHDMPVYPMKGQYQADYVDGYQGRSRMTPGGYPGYPGNFSPSLQGAAQNNMYPPQYNTGPNPNGISMPPRPDRPPHMMGPGTIGAKQDLTYGQTKPLSHYPEPTSSTGPSSLQQLQNQVQSHFNQPQVQQGQVQITQSQHMHMTHGSQRMHMSQTQQMQIQGGSAHPISMAQQQSFSMPPGGMGPGPTQQQQLYMRMYQDKMHAEQQQQGQHPQQMQQYMNRPPPDYKMAPGNMNGNYPPTSIAQAHGVNPLQTMQNMVNQTNQPIPPGSGPRTNGMYPHGPGGPIKSEGPMGPAGMPGQMGNVPRQGSPMPQNYPPSTQGPRGPPMMPPQQQMAVQNGASGTAQNQSMKPGTPTYSSAIMRNQRPPNVNVGPDGLNISQQRPLNSEWPRGMVPNGASGSPQVTRPQMPNNSMMQYGYQGQAAMMGGQGGARMQMTQQQMHVSQGRQQGMPHPNMAGHPHMAQQQAAVQRSQMMSQNMHMAQQQQQSSHSMPNMNMSQSMTTTSSTSNPQARPSQSGQNPTTVYPPVTTANGTSDFPLADFLADNSQANNSDFFDSMVQNPTQPDIFDEIFGPGK